MKLTAGRASEHYNELLKGVKASCRQLRSLVKHNFVMWNYMMLA